ncbi:MAG: hypothetical protein WBJ19_05005, partial [Rhodoferax sp.]
QFPSNVGEQNKQKKASSQGSTRVTRVEPVGTPLSGSGWFHPPVSEPSQTTIAGLMFLQAICVPA